MSTQKTPPSAPKTPPKDAQPAVEVENIRGVFSTQEIRRVGTGTTTRKTVQKNFWFVEQKPDGTLECQPLNSNYIPSGPKRTLTMDEIINKFSPEPEFYLNSVFPKMQEMQRSIDNADAHRNKGETFTAEFEYGTALKLDEDNVRANFGIGLTYLQRGDAEKAEDIFQRLVKLDAAFETEHKHLFNDFGISLRKNKMFSQAVTYYGRALELSAKDENLHMNMARALLETRDINGCLDHLCQALALNPNHETTRKFLEWLDQKSLIPQDKMPAVQAALAGQAMEPQPEAEEKAAAEAPAEPGETS